jgi:hypothetical protein
MRGNDPRAGVGAKTTRGQRALRVGSSRVRAIPPFLEFEVNDEGILLVEIVGVVATGDDVAELERGFVALYDRFQPPIDVVIGMSRFTLRAEVARNVSTMRARLLTTRVRHTARYAVPRVLATLIHTTAALSGIDAFLFDERAAALASIRARRATSSG